MVAETRIDDILSRSGEMGRLIRAKDWSTTELGPITSWPQSLVTALSICLTSRFPIQLWWGPELVIAYNDAYIPIAGARHPELLGRRGAEVFTETWDVIGPMFQQVMSGGEATWSEDRRIFLHRNGYLEECYFTWSYSPVQAESGGVAGVFCAVQETTKRVVGERRLKILRELSNDTANVKSVEDVSAKATRVLEQNSLDLPFSALYLVDPARPDTLVLTGTTGLEAGSPLCRSEVVCTDTTSVWPFARVLSEGTLVRVEALDQRFTAVPAGPWADPPQAAACLPIASSDQGHPAGVLVVGLNPRRAFDDDYRGFLALASGQIATAIQTARAYQEERRRAEALAQLDRAKTEFFSNVSHEFRTPLTLMLGPVEDILSDRHDPLSPARRSELERVHRNTRRLLKLVNNLLDFSRIEADRAQARYEPSDLRKLTAGFASVFRSAIERAGLYLHLELDSLPEEIFVDHDMWEKVILNLLSNAFKFTFTGGVTVRLAWLDGKARLQVSDTGIGVPANELPRLFERFHRVQGSRGRTHEGTGIGLALVNELVALHGGTITAESVLDVGTTFTVLLPSGSSHLPAGRIGERRTVVAAPSSSAGAYLEEVTTWLPRDEEPSPGSELEPRSERAEHVDTRSTGSERVLVADDNQDMRDYVAGLLRTHWRVEVAGDGHEALAKIRQLAPDLVVTDVMMPGLDGFGLLEAIRSSPATAEIPVVMLSARAGESARVDGFGAGADDYLVKPFSARELVARVDAVLDRSRSRHEARRAAELQRARIYSLFMQAPAAIAVLRGRDFVHELANASYRQLVGPDRPVIGRPLAEALPELDPALVAILTRVFTSGERYSGREYPIVLETDGQGSASTKYVNFVYEPLKDASDNVEGVMLFAYEVTAQVRARQDVERLAREAEAANVTKSQFIANMSHEIRTPLGVILGFADLALDPDQSVDDARNYLTAIKRNGQQLLEILGDILDLSKIEANKLEIERVPFSLAGLLEDVAAMLTPRAREKGLTLSFERDGSLPDLIQTDSTRLRQIFVNLIGNAIKFTERGSVVIACRALAPVSAGAPVQLSFTVKDTGIGISAEHRQKLFQPFVQADSSTTRKFGGTGLGLLLSRQLARALGGDLELTHSEVGKGSCFHFTVQAEAVASPAIESEKSAFGGDRDSNPQASSSAPLEGLRVLLVEDSADNQVLVSRYLRSVGAAVDLADNGLDAVEMATAGDYDVVLMDIQMPILDGHESTARLRRAGYARPILALTAHAMREERERALKGGFDDYLTKPLQRSVLVKTLRAFKRS